METIHRVYTFRLYTFVFGLQLNIFAGIGNTSCLLFVSATTRILFDLVAVVEALILVKLEYFHEVMSNYLDIFRKCFILSIQIVTDSLTRNMTPDFIKSLDHEDQQCIYSICDRKFGTVSFRSITRFEITIILK